MPPTAIRTRTMDAFNNGRPLRVVVGDDGRLGVVDDARFRVWFGTEARSTRCTIPSREVTLPPFPDKYGKFIPKPIGGVSRTVRRIGCIRTKHRHTGAVIVFATLAPTIDCVSTAIRDHCSCEVTLGDSEVDEEFGNVTEIVVHESQDVDHVCAVVARTGAIPVLEENKHNALQGIGVERLDRIDSECVTVEDHDSSFQFGARRGEKNWRFAWLPDEWVPPITWDHMIANVKDLPIESIPQPLRQHVAADRIKNENYDPIGTRWRISETPPTQSELDFEGEPALPMRTILRNAELSSILPQRDRLTSEERETLLPVSKLNSTRYLLKGDDGQWYRPRDTRNFLSQQIPDRRWVSAALQDEQSEQLINAFYLLSVERVKDETIRMAASLILFRYMFERGYTARYMGKYVQDAVYIGNGIRYREFKRLSQYDPSRLPIAVLAKICGADGRLINRGSKGTRSKYRTTNRYIPKRRLKRTEKDEEEMITNVDKRPRVTDAASTSSA